MNYFSRFHMHAGSRMVDAGAQTCTWSPVPRPVHRDRDPGPESRDARQFSLSARWGMLASGRVELWRAKPQVRSGGAGVVAVLVALFSP